MSGNDYNRQINKEYDDRVDDYLQEKKLDLKYWSFDAICTAMVNALRETQLRCKLRGGNKFLTTKTNRHTLLFRCDPCKITRQTVVAYAKQLPPNITVNATDG